MRSAACRACPAACRACVKVVFGKCGWVVADARVTMPAAKTADGRVVVGAVAKYGRAHAAGGLLASMTSAGIISV